MKIGILTESVSYHSGARAPLEIAKYLLKSGNQITVYSYDLLKDPQALFDLKKNGVEVIIIPSNKIPIIRKYLAAILLFKRLKKDLPNILIFSGTLPFFIAGKLSKLPVIRMYLGTQFNAYLEKLTPDTKPTFIQQLINKVANSYIYLNEMIIFHLSKAVVGISKYSAKEGENLYKRKVETFIYLGATKLSSSVLNKKPADNFNLISVSRITPYKGFHLIIKALKKIRSRKKIVLTIVGSQPKQNYLKYLRKIGGKNLRIAVNPTDKQLANYYKMADIYLSADRYLYFGLPIYEAGLFKVPTVSFDLAAAKEIIGHKKSGFVAKSTNDFAKYLKILIEDKALRKKMGLDAYKKAKYYSWKFCAENWEKVLKKYAVNYEK